MNDGEESDDSQELFVQRLTMNNKNNDQKANADLIEQRFTFLEDNKKMARSTQKANNLAKSRHRHGLLIHQTVESSISIMDEMNYMLALIQLGVTNEDPFHEVTKKFDHVCSKLDQFDYSHLFQDQDEAEIERLKENCKQKMVSELTNGLMTIKGYRQKHGTQG